MSPEEITSMLKQVRGGKLSVEDAVERLRTLPYEDLGYAKIDHHRSLRQGFPEVVFARGKDSGAGGRHCGAACCATSTTSW